jgi:N-acetylglucosaminyl-diphospho-decaprenol L-rhamnosyltransferase
MPPASRAPAAQRTLALVTVTHNSAAVLTGLLSSVAEHLPGVVVVVVDCASIDGTLGIARAYPSTVTVALPNVGFGQANNRGVAEVQAAVTALVNPDVELLDDSLLALAAELTRTNRPERLLAPLVLSPDGSRQDTVHPLPGSPADLVRALFPPALASGTAVAPWGARHPRRVGWAVGCAIAARTDTLRRLGPFDERIFLYSEDLDLGLRAATAGVQTWFWPASRVLHHGGHSTHVAFGGEPFERQARARREVVARRLGKRRAALDDAGQALTFATRLLAKPALGRSAARERAQLQALRSARRSDRASVRAER